MSYETLEAGLQAQIRALDAFSDQQVSLADWTVLAEGHANVAILEYQSFELERESYGQDTRILWVCRVNLLARYSDDATGNDILRDRRSEIVAKVLQNPTLGGTAEDALPASGNFVVEEIEWGGVSFLSEWIDVQMEEVVSA